MGVWARLAAGLVAGVVAAALGGCDAFRTHPYAVPQDAEQRDHTEKNLRWLERLEATETFSFAVMGDTQRWEDEVPGAVRSINADPEVRFALHVGDITEFGLAREYVWMNEHFARLEVPFFTVVGNHDLLGNGGAIYDAVYGQRNYTFLFGRTKFVMLDSNSREYRFNGAVPDVAWLEAELLPDPAWDQAVVVSHVPPGNGDFDDELVEAFEAAIARWGNVPLCLHGHEHRSRDERVARGAARLVMATKLEDRVWTKVTLSPDRVRVEEVAY